MKKKSQKPSKALPPIPQPTNDLEPAPHPEESGVNDADDTGLTTAGNIDRRSDCVIYGWAALKEGGVYKHASVELLVDGLPMSMCEANLMREDLKNAGIGAGLHGFEFQFPEEFCDGVGHAIAIRVRETGEFLPNAVGTVRVSRVGLLNRMEIDGSSLFCAGELNANATLDSLSLYEASTLVLTTRDIKRNGRAFEVRFLLPRQLCDGNVHAFAVRAGTEGPWMGEEAFVTPFFRTPIHAILDVGGGPVGPSLHPAARRRYDGLTEGMQQAARAPEGEGQALLRNLMTAHDVLVQGCDVKALKKSAYAPLVFPRHKAPKVSVVIPAHNKFAVTYFCLASLVVAPNRCSFEVILVDDGSSDETGTVEEIISGITVVRNETALGFVLACNAGAKAARGQYIVMLNNDTEVTPHWIDELVWPFENFEGVGLTGSKLVYPDGKLQEAGGIVWDNGQPWNLGRNGNPEDPSFNYARQVDYISGACIMLPKPLWDQLGGFDEEFAPAYYEDTDLAFRVRQKGYKTVYAPLSEVIHFEGVSNGKSESSSGLKRFQAINKPKFTSRWISALRNNGKPGKDVALAKDRNVSMRALVIDHMAPKFDQEAGGFAAIQEMRLLQALGFKLTFAPENMAYMGRYTQVLQRSGIECIHAPFAHSVPEVLEKRGSEFDVIYVTRYSVAAKIIDAVRRHAPNAKILFCNADLHFLREVRHAVAMKNKDLMQSALATRDAELEVMRKVDLVLSYNEAEHAVILSHNLDSTRVAKCPWVVDVPEQVPGFDTRKDIAFLGGFGHPPNKEAVEFFVKDVMPLLRERLPEARFVIYGSRIPQKLEDLAGDGVVIGGWVEDVAEVFNTCRVFVAPLRSGAGIKGKVISALAHGTPSVISTIAHEGTGASEDTELLVADTPKQWVEAIHALYTDPVRWAEMSAAAQAMARRRYSFEAGKKLMRAALEQVQVYVPEDHSALYTIR